MGNQILWISTRKVSHREMAPSLKLISATSIGEAEGYESFKKLTFRYLWRSTLLHNATNLPDIPPSNGSNPIDFGKACCNPVIIGSTVVIWTRIRNALAFKPELCNDNMPQIADR